MPPSKEHLPGKFDIKFCFIFLFFCLGGYKVRLLFLVRASVWWGYVNGYEVFCLLWFLLYGEYFDRLIKALGTGLIIFV
jgi:hypothetical protein